MSIFYLKQEKQCISYWLIWSNVFYRFPDWRQSESHFVWSTLHTQLRQTLKLVEKQDIINDARGRKAKLQSCRKWTDKRINHLPPLRRLKETVNLKHFSRQRVTGQVRGLLSMESKKEAAADKQVMQHIFIETFSQGVTWAYKGQDSRRKKKSSNEMGWGKKQTNN